MAEWRRTQKQFLGWQHQYATDTARRDFEAAQDVRSQFTLEGRVLDIGGGAGLARSWLAPNQQYVSLEPDLSWREKLPVFAAVYPEVSDPFPQIFGVAEYLPFRSNTFDSVLMRGVIDHCFDAHLALAEAYRVMRPTGTLVVGLSLGGINAKAKSLTDRGLGYSVRYLGSKALAYATNGFAGYGTGHRFHIHNEDVTALLREHSFEVEQECFSTLLPRARYFIARRPAEFASQPT